MEVALPLQMRNIDMIGIAGAVFLVTALIFGFTDAELLDHWYDWVFGPFLWVFGGALVSVFVLVRVFFTPDKISH